MLLRREYRGDFEERLQDEPETTFDTLTLTKDDILEDEDLMTRLWAIYQKDVEEYDCSPEWSFCDAVFNVLGVRNPNWEY